MTRTRQNLGAVALLACIVVSAALIAGKGPAQAANGDEPNKVYLPMTSLNVGAPGTRPNTATPTDSAQATATASATASATVSATVEATYTPTLTVTSTPTPTLTTEPTVTETPTTGPTPTSTATLEPPAPVETVLIAAGSFEMGCDALRDTCLPDELPLHSVTLSAYRIDKHEVSNAHYGVCVAEGACDPPSRVNSFTRRPYYGNPAFADYPVIYVGWTQAKTYCEWLGKRLPTEAEWERAARGDADTRVYPWGDGAPACDLANYEPGCVGDTAAVGSYVSGVSPFGVMDMSGNVSEWVNDWYAEDYYATSPAENPTGPASGELRVLRGGGWHFGAGFVRATNRFKDFPGDTELATGFRCASSE